MKIMRLAVALVIVGAAAAYWQGTESQRVTAPAEAKASPEDLLNKGLAFETAWRGFKAGKGDPPNPFTFDHIDRALGEVSQDWPKAEEAIALIERIRKDRPDIEKAWRKADSARLAKSVAESEKQLLQQRREYPKTAEVSFLDAGQDVYITAEGKDLRTLKVKYILMSRPLAHQIGQNEKLIGAWRGLGFHRVVLTDGYRDGWKLDLK